MKRATQFVKGTAISPSQIKVLEGSSKVTHSIHTFSFLTLRLHRGLFATRWCHGSSSSRPL
jgi:hypothetical protein